MLYLHTFETHRLYNHMDIEFLYKRYDGVVKEPNLNILFVVEKNLMAKDQNQILYGLYVAVIKMVFHEVAGEAGAGQRGPGQSGLAAPLQISSKNCWPE